MATLDFSELEGSPPGEASEALVRLIGERLGLLTTPSCHLSGAPVNSRLENSRGLKEFTGGSGTISTENLFGGQGARVPIRGSTRSLR